MSNKPAKPAKSTPTKPDPLTDGFTPRQLIRYLDAVPETFEGLGRAELEYLLEDGFEVRTLLRDLGRNYGFSSFQFIMALATAYHLGDRTTVQSLRDFAAEQQAQAHQEGLYLKRYQALSHAKAPAHDPFAQPQTPKILSQAPEASEPPAHADLVTAIRVLASLVK